MRHASIQTTMNVHGRAMTGSKRRTHNKVVPMPRASGKEELDKEHQEVIVNVVQDGLGTCARDFTGYLSDFTLIVIRA